MCVCTHVWAESQKFMLILAISIWHHSIHSSFLPVHIFNSLLRQWKIWHLLSLICINPLICNHCQHHPFPHPVASLKFWLTPCTRVVLWCALQSMLMLSARLHSRPTRTSLTRLWALMVGLSPYSTQHVCSVTTRQAGQAHIPSSPCTFWFSVPDKPTKCVPSSPCLAFSSLFSSSGPPHLYPEAGMANLFWWFSHQTGQQRRGKKEKKKKRNRHCFPILTQAFKVSNISPYHFTLEETVVQRD